MQPRLSPQHVTPADTPRTAAMSHSQNQNAVQISASVPNQTLVAEAAALAENVSAKEIALRLKLLQRVFRWW
jgi:hypothetical protein